MASLRAGSSESGGEDASWGDLFGRRYLKGIHSLKSCMEYAFSFLF